MDDSAYRQIMYIQDGGPGERHMVLGTAADLAREMQLCRMYDEYVVAEVFGLDQMGDLKPLRWEVTGVPAFDDNDYAYPDVVVHFPDGHRDVARYRIDGRS